MHIVQVHRPEAGTAETPNESVWDMPVSDVFAASWRKQIHQIVPELREAADVLRMPVYGAHTIQRNRH